MPMGQPMPGIGQPGGSNPQAAPVAESDSGLVELSIYGVASLYERYHPKSQPAAGTPPNPNTPPGPGLPNKPPELPKK
jgi:hypothetical protein